jgi:hypothetical protein
MIQSKVFDRETPSTVVGEKVTLTPQIAAQILKTPGLLDIQRQISRGHVDALSHDMKAGRWMPYQAEVVFAYLPSGTIYLIDGQHVLHACALSGITIQVSQRILVCANVDEVRERFGKFGVQRSRTTAQVIQSINLNTMLDTSLQTTVVSAYKMLLHRLSYKTGQIHSASSRKKIGNTLVKSHTQALAVSAVHIMDEVAEVLDEARFFQDTVTRRMRGPKVSVSRVALMHMIPLIMSGDRTGRKFWVDVCAGKQGSSIDGVGHALDVLKRSGKKGGGAYAHDDIMTTQLRLESCLGAYRRKEELNFVRTTQFDLHKRCLEAGIPTVLEWIDSYRTAKKVANGSESTIRWSVDKRGFISA